MIVQSVIRGVGDLRRDAVRDDVAEIMTRTGLVCAALRTGRVASPGDAEDLLGPTALDDHRHRHHLMADESPYISMTAGTYVERHRRNRAAYAFDTALAFATHGHQRPGWVFYGYVFLLGRAAGLHAEFGEEVRDVHQHPAWSRFRAEGEVAVPVRVPPRRLQRAELYTPDDVRDALRAGVWPPDPSDVEDNEASGRYCPPEDLLGARGVV
ncbi:hypothetical protein Q9R32_10825 [Actinotalea sp. AC32]|nr:hypothetical protein [Actinotalea sp. AC32]